MRGYRLLLHLPPEGGRRKIGNGGRVEMRERERDTASTNRKRDV